MLKPIVLTASVLLLASGCTSTPPVAPGCTTFETAQARGAAHPAINMMSPEIGSILDVRSVNVTRTSTGLAAVAVEVRNCTDADLVLIMRTRFNGAAGQSEPTSAWKEVYLAPRALATYGENAVSAKTTAVSVDIYDKNRGQNQFKPGQTYLLPPLDDEQRR